MGTFAGHVIPGTVLVGWGAWWYGNTLRQIRLSHTVSQPNSAPSAVTASDSRIQRDGTWDAPVYFTILEPALKIGIAAVAILVELWWASWRFVDSSVLNYQHATMWLFFVAAGATDLLTMRDKLPMYAGRIALIVAFFFEAFMFIGHHNPTPLEMTLHRLLIYVILCQVFVLVLEWRYKHVALGVVKSFVLILQGTWLWQVGYMIFLAQYDPANHTNQMRGYLFFTWHFFAVAILMYLVHYVVNKRRFSVQGRSRMAAL